MGSLSKKIAHKNPFEKRIKSGFRRKSILEIEKVPEKKRLKYLDFIKGLACIMMLFAHFPAGDFFGLKHFFGSFAPFLFFACTGITSGLALKRKDKFLGLVFIYFLFFIFSLSCNFMRRPEELLEYQNPFLNFDFFQIIAVGAIFSFVLHKLKIGFFGSLLLFLSILGVHFSNQASPFSFGQRILFSPGIFTIFPWLAFFVLGHMYEKLSRESVLFLNVFLGFSCFVIFCLEQIGFSNFSFDKWNLDLSYLLLGLMAWSFSFSIFSYLEERKFKLIFLAMLGKYSMIFVYAHFFIKKIFYFYEKDYRDLTDIEMLVLGSAFSIFFTMFLASAFGIFNKNFRIRNPLKFFLILFFIPFLPFLQNEVFIMIYYFLFGVIFSVKFGELSGQILRVRKKAARSS